MPFIQLQFRRDTAPNWFTHNPTLASGEFGLETDTQLFKIGDGLTPWRLLPYGGLRGATGETGAEGPTGAPGLQGDTGLAGTVGASGSQGETGPTGLDGPTGPAGEATNTGATGPAGSAGATGSTGPTGLSGAPGSAGATGPTGSSGPAGTNGTPGATGPTGPSVSASAGTLRIPISGGSFVPGSAVSTVPSSFATFNAGSSTASSFVFNLNGAYTTSNFPVFLGTVVYYNGSQYNYMNLKYGATTTAGVNVVINSGVTTLTFSQVNTTNFPSATNDASGYALTIIITPFN